MIRTKGAALRSDERPLRSRERDYLERLAVRDELRRARDEARQLFREDRAASFATREITHRDNERPDEY